MQVNILPFYIPTAPRWVKRSKHFFSEVGHDAYYIKLKGKTCRRLCKFHLMQTPDRSDIEVVQISIF